MQMLLGEREDLGFFFIGLVVGRSIGYKNSLFRFHVTAKSRKNLISTITHLTRYIEVVLMRMGPHTFSHMEQNSTSISDFN